MQIALLHKHLSPAHLELVKAEMVKLGPPTIKAVWMECYDLWAALEGCHRIRAAAELGLPVEIDEVEYSDKTLAELGCDCEDETVTVADVADSANNSKIIEL